MKQWNLSKRSTYGGSVKVEPIPRAISETAVSQIGSALGNHVTDGPTKLSYHGKTLYEGRGYKAPMNKSHSRNRGSQGSY